ncbi:MAG: hypothetical protein KGI54_10550 [Pseudomonadota bacterium]|nr:hypothetical protein [Pseudomonadota bacterium]
MIEQSFPAKKTKLEVVLSSSPSDIWESNKRKITLEEYRRRDTIVRKYASECKLKVGDTCYPVELSDYVEHGAMLITSIVQHYKDFGFSEEWPDNDNPFLISLKSLTNKGAVMFCTTNWVVAKNPHLMVEC